MGRVEKTGFISYRRTNLPWALAIYQHLTHHGYDVFFDDQSIPSGSFEQVILENIRTRAHFVVILTPSALARCTEPDDWFRREIETAIDERRNIVSLMLDGFDFESPLAKDALTGKLASLSTYDALRVHTDDFFKGMDTLRTKLLNAALRTLSVSDQTPDVQSITRSQQLKADEASPVGIEQLKAQEWFERGYVLQTEAKNLQEAVHCYREAIRLDPTLSHASNNLGRLLQDLKRYDEAETAYRQTIELEPSNAVAYHNLGALLITVERYEEAEAVYRRAIELDPSRVDAQYWTGHRVGQPGS
jgi:tetratricopeptide (TPR) repeat protein